MVRNGNTLTLNLPMTFLEAYAGREVHLPVRRGSLGVQQRLAAIGHLDRAVKTIDWLRFLVPESHICGDGRRRVTALAMA